ncbi:unnamed protein product [Heligmosomoides polygyrus]|uniref:Col_cuticle_N domain-containing protein n=1 Tax=Heligmosomoides polygyrus TaxID=6339 RepID=A0A183GJ31_HELPZ|nr:unnamed protein product [Heligmosomoides polygyrus]
MPSASALLRAGSLYFNVNIKKEYKLCMRPIHQTVFDFFKVFRLPTTVHRLTYRRHTEDNHRTQFPAHFLVRSCCVRRQEVAMTDMVNREWSIPFLVCSISVLVVMVTMVGLGLALFLYLQTRPPPSKRFYSIED